MVKNRWIVTADKFLSAEQIASLLDYLTRERDLAIARANNPQAIRDFYMIRTLLETGLRISEFCSLSQSDLHGLRLMVRLGKGGKPRTVLLTRTTSNLLKEWTTVKIRLGFSSRTDAPMFPSRFQRHYTTRGIQKRVDHIFGTLGFPSQLSAHSLRHTYCSLLIASGKVGLGTVRDNLGHHSIAVTNLYTHATGSIADVDLYSQPSSHFSQLSELRGMGRAKKASSSVRSFLRNANFKAEVSRVRARGSQIE